MQDIDRTSGRHVVGRFSTAACVIALGLAGLSGLALIGTDGWVAGRIDDRLGSVADRWQGGEGIKLIASGDESYWLKRHPDLLPAMFQDSGKAFVLGDRITVGGADGGPTKVFEIVEFTPINLERTADTSAQRSLRLVTAKETSAVASGTVLRFVVETNLASHQTAIGAAKSAPLNKAL